MINFILIGVCILAGWLFRRTEWLPADAHKGINAWIIYLALPAVSFKWLPHISWSANLIVPILAPVVVWLGGWLYVSLYARKIALDRPSVGGLKLVTGLSNTSFVGFPLVSAWFGEKQLGTAVICDQATFLLISTAGIAVAINASGSHRLSAGLLLKKLFKFPPFIASLSALVLPHFFDISAFDPLFEKLAATTAPLALFSIGLQLQFKGWTQYRQPIAVSLFYKLVLAPAIILCLLLLLKLNGLIAQVSFFEMAMPSLLTSGVVAAEYDLNPKLTSLVIGIGILLSLATTAGWYFLLKVLM